MGMVKARGPGVPKIQDSRSHLAETRGDPCTGSSARSGPDRVKAHFCMNSFEYVVNSGCKIRPGIRAGTFTRTHREGTKIVRSICANLASFLFLLQEIFFTLKTTHIAQRHHVKVRCLNVFWPRCLMDFN